MKRVHATALVLSVVISGVVAGCAAATQSSDLNDRPHPVAKYAGRHGAVVRQGTILTLNADRMPADALRIIPAMVHSAKPHIRTPARHLHTYATVVVRPDETAPEVRGVVTLPRGTRLVVLEHKAERQRVRLFTRTADLVRSVDGTMVYGCTEFIFPIGEASDTTAVRR